MFVSIRCVLFAAALSLAGVPVAHSEPSAEKSELVARVHVKTSDLDLGKEADARILLTRLATAAFEACGGPAQFHRSYDLMPLHTERVFRQCREKATAQAVADIHSPTVSRLFAETHGASSGRCAAQRTVRSLALGDQKATRVPKPCCSASV